MTSLESALHRIAADLDRSHVNFALVGGLAVSVRTEPRFTRDADFAVAVASDAEAEALIRRLRAGGYEVAAIVEQDAVGRLATARLTVSGEVEGPVADLLFASSGIEREIVASAAGAGGSGGNGGRGGRGMPGGRGGSRWANDAGVLATAGEDGAKGGNGGDGGSGAGGNGGPSHALVFKGARPTMTGTALSAGAAGAKGVGGTAGGVKAPLARWA